MNKIGIPLFSFFLTLSTLIANAQVTGETNPCQNQSYTYTLNGETCLAVQWSITGGSVYTTSNKYVVNVIWTSTGGQSLTAYTIGQAPGCNTYLETINVSVRLKPSAPALTKSSGNQEICSGESWTLTASLSGFPTNYGYDWYTTGGLLIDGNSSSSTSPVHTTSNQVTLTPGSAYASCAIYVRMHNYSDCPSDYTNITIQVGTYSSSQFSIYGPSSSCPNSSLSFTPGLAGPPVTGYAWTAPSGWSPTTSSSQNFYTTTPSSFFGGVVTLQLQNRCGWTGSPATLFVSGSSCGGGGYYMMTASPNPASERIDITRSAEDDVLTVPTGTVARVFDNTGMIRATAVELGGQLSLDVSTLPAGLYVVRVYDGLQVTSKQVEVMH